MAYDVCILQGTRKCSTWPILDPSTQIHPGLSLGGAGNGVCVSHAKSLIRDAKRGDLDIYAPDGTPVTLEGKDPETGLTDPDFRRRIEVVHDVWKRVSGASYLKAVRTRP